jgi:hypothetical protein
MCNLAARTSPFVPETAFVGRPFVAWLTLRVLSDRMRTPLRDRCAKSAVMRIETGGKYEWRIELYDDAGDLLNESTRSGAVDGACEFTKEMLPALERAVEHPDMTEDLADVLSTSVVEVEYQVERDVNVHD